MDNHRARPLPPPQEHAPAPREAEARGAARRARSPAPRAERTLVWSGKLWVCGRSEELKVPVAAYALAGSSRTRPSWGEHLKCDPRGLETRDMAARMANNLRSPGFAQLRAVDDSGDEVVDARIEKVAQVIEDRGAVFVGLNRDYFVLATRGEDNQIGLVVLYEQG